MADWLTLQQRSYNMASIRSRGNITTEGTLASVLRSAGLTGWRRHVPLPGKPDFVFRPQRVAVFVDGCFWHGCPRCYRLPEDNRGYWSAKVAGNRRRDRKADAELRTLGWKVLRIWEHSLRTEAGKARAAAKMRHALGITLWEPLAAVAEPAPAGWKTRKPASGRRRPRTP